MNCVDGKTCICGICGKEYIWKLTSNGTKSTCNSCITNKRRIKLKERAVKYKGGKCEICGYNKFYGALTFHHVDPTKKEFEISGGHTRSWENIKKELDKTNLLCQNCHHEVHGGLHVGRLV